MKHKRNALIGLTACCPLLISLCGRRLGRRTSRCRCWWFWGIVAGGLGAWLYLRRRSTHPTAPVTRKRITLPARPPAITEPRAAVELEPVPDDLRRIEGIGPRIASLLQAAGITSFARLAEAEAGQLRQVLREGRVIADPTTWPEQAALAAVGKEEQLAALQGELKGGRRAED